MRLLVTRYSNREINLAGEDLVRWFAGEVQGDEWREPFAKVTAFRQTHAYPLRVVTKVLRSRALSVDPNAYVYSRIKRMVSIILKLDRIRTMQATTMQDLGGCRAVLTNISAVLSLLDQFKQIESKLDDPKVYNYIESPKPDGYRSVHVTVKYKPKNPQYSSVPSRRIEIQVRTTLQHQWATALETIDLFTRQSLKLGGGYAPWKRFFLLASEVFARKEGTPSVPACPFTYEETMKELRDLWTSLRISERFNTWVTAVQKDIPQEVGKDAMYLIETDVEKKTTSVRVFSSDAYVSAFAEYNLIEQRNASDPTRSAVLVTAASVIQLREAFPSYYGDTSAFLGEIEQEITQ